jgi:hypothetical protein
MNTATVRLIGGRWHGRVIEVPVDPTNQPWSPMGWPDIEIPWRPLLVYELDRQNLDGTWTFRYRKAHYGGW